MDFSVLLSRVRTDIGDPEIVFRDVSQGDGLTVWFDLSRERIIQSGFAVTVISGATVTDLDPTGYTMDWDAGQITLVNPPVVNSQILFTGTSYGMFSDSELTTYLRDAVHWHCHNRQTSERYRDRHGWIAYREVPVTLGNLPAIEEPLLVMRAVLNVLWAIADDAASDVNVQTAEGTNIDRAQRYGQVMKQIAALTERYRIDCAQLQVGPYRMESLNQRIVSQSTGRLIPLFTEREFDDRAYPTRQIPPIDSHDEDASGVPSSLWYGSPV
jgi:hypothetical protein